MFKLTTHYCRPFQDIHYSKDEPFLLQWDTVSSKEKAHQTESHFRFVYAKFISKEMWLGIVTNLRFNSGFNCLSKWNKSREWITTWLLEPQPQTVPSSNDDTGSVRVGVTGGALCYPHPMCIRRRGIAWSCHIYNTPLCNEAWLEAELRRLNLTRSFAYRNMHEGDISFALPRVLAEYVLSLQRSFLFGCFRYKLIRMLLRLQRTTVEHFQFHRYDQWKTCNG